MKRVLIVDDDVDIRDSLALLLEDRYEVVTAADGRQALAVLQREGADVVLLDLMMPGLSGEDVVRELRRRGDDVPVALISAARELAASGRRLAVEAFLAKPFELAALERMIARLLAGGEAPPPACAPDGGAEQSAGEGEPGSRAHRLQVGSPPQSGSPQSIA